MLMNTHRLHLIAVQCADIRPFGAYISSKFFAGGFAFHTAAEASAWVMEQLERNTREGNRSDFSAAVAGADGESFSRIS